MRPSRMTGKLTQESVCHSFVNDRVLIMKGVAPTHLTHAPADFVLLTSTLPCKVPIKWTALLALQKIFFGPCGLCIS